MKQPTRIAAASLALALLAACSGSSSPTGATTSAPGNSAAGMVTDGVGAPVADAKVEIHGPASANAGLSTYDAKTGADGRYTQGGITPGTAYTVYAMKDITYNGKTYHVRFKPKTGDANEKFDSTKGIARDFQLVASGKVPGAPDPEDYYGGVVNVNNWYTVDGDQPAVGSKLDITLHPTGPLLDNSQGQDLKWSVTQNGEARLDHKVDVPVGRYAVTATLTTPDGAQTPLKVAALGAYGGPTDYLATATLDFEPGDSALPTSAATLPARIYFHR
jgi:hypothetical protein